MLETADIPPDARAFEGAVAVKGGVVPSASDSPSLLRRLWSRRATMTVWVNLWWWLLLTIPVGMMVEKWSLDAPDWTAAFGAGAIYGIGVILAAYGLYYAFLFPVILPTVAITVAVGMIGYELPFFSAGPFTDNALDWGLVAWLFTAIAAGAWRSANRYYR